ncbi:MAG: hypothetical protein ACD_78C00055G0002 [uncultured bacterium (gcode 4)]|uniref:Uncharacterized protein n=1 Tax=uncultured bacterium (gcode 4) TaxID=1234023 RepID=K1XZ62_9BACT|nr:MAG: hypothetical protein ACD_78C00055G0002 [uncultured bacterium (gcode 4)]
MKKQIRATAHIRQKPLFFIQHHGQRNQYFFILDSFSKGYTMGACKEFILFLFILSNENPPAW